MDTLTLDEWLLRNANNTHSVQPRTQDRFDIFLKLDIWKRYKGVNGGKKLMTELGYVQNSNYASWQSEIQPGNPLAKFKLCKVRSVQFGQKGIPYINTYDGRTIRYPDPLIKANDTIKLDLEAQKITDFMVLKDGHYDNTVVDLVRFVRNVFLHIREKEKGPSRRFKYIDGMIDWMDQQFVENEITKKFPLLLVHVHASIWLTGTRID